MVTGKFIRGNDDLSEVEGVRMRVFVEEQGFPAEEEMDAYDARAIHCLLYDGEGKPAATGRLYIDDDGYWRIGRVAVVRERRGQQMGDLLMRMLLDKALNAGARHFRLSAQKQAEGFYRRYGFTPFGEEYLDGTVPHVEMEATNESILRAVFSGCRGEEMLRREREGKKEE
ncbi:MAG: GNAT family N-acetyltransferase [Candidatus Spyradocola sp.]|jgi:predicted GNAT family N-acyltransferase